MRIEKLKFLNDYKCIKKDTEIDFGSGNYCALVGLNGSGKSSVLNYLLSVMLHQNNGGLYSLYESNIIWDYICTNDDKLPKLVVHIYNGETKFGSRFSYNEQDNIYILQLDSSIWCLASFILQIENDTLIDDLELKCQEVEDLIRDWEKKSEADYLDKLYNNIPKKKGSSRIKNRLNDNYEDNDSEFLEKSFNTRMRKRKFINKLSYNKIEDVEPNMWKWILEEQLKEEPINFSFVVTNFSVPPQHNYFHVVASYILQYGKEDDNGIWSVHSLQNRYLKHFYNNTTLQLSEGQKSRLVLQLALKYLAVEEKNTLFLLDEPDAYLDVQKKRDFFNLIRECKGQVIMSTHDPIMTKWMKGHLIFMKDGEQIPSDMVETINELSDGEVSFQETLLMFKKEYVVVVEGKSDLECIEKAIRSNCLTSEFEQVFFLAQNSASSTQATFDNFLSKVFENHKHIKHILFLYDADDAGYKGKTQLEKIKEEYKNNDISKKIDYLFYRPCYYSAENSSFDNNIKDYFYLEGYFPVDCYPENKEGIINLRPHKELYDLLDDKNEDKFLNYNEIIRLKFFADEIKNKNGLKSYFGNHTDKIDEKYFIGFRPLLDKILEKLGLPNDPTA